MIAAIFAPQGLVVGRSAAVKAPSASMMFQTTVESKFDGIWSHEAKMECYAQWDPEAPRSYDNFNPFERNDEAQQCDVNGCFPGQGKGYQVPNRPDINWARQQELNAIMEELKKEPKFQSTGKPGNWSPKWQDGMNAPGL